MNTVTVLRSGVGRIHTFRSKVIRMFYVDDRVCVLTDNGVYLADKNGKRFRRVKPYDPEKLLKTGLTWDCNQNHGLVNLNRL